MKKNGLISVVVPIYNVEKYLEDCIESILRQTYRDLEILLIDDGSWDGCGEICDRYARMDSRITVVHQKNGGAAAAKNCGLRMATGEFIAIVDGDDYLEPNAYEKLMAALREHDADIAQGKMNLVYVNTAEVLNPQAETVSYSATEYLLRFFWDWSCALCPDKLFRRHVLTDIFFEEGHCIDDEFFTYLGVMNAGKIVCIPDIVYHYRQRASSVMKDRSTTQRKFYDILDYLEKRKRNVIARFPELKTRYEGHYADYLLWLATSDMASKTAIKEIKRLLLRHIGRGNVQFWKKGQRKQALRILAFLVKPAGMHIPGEQGVTDSGYELYQ